MSAKYGKMGAEMFDSLSVAVTMNWAKQQVEPATASVDEEQVRDICEEYFANVKMQPRVIEVHAPASTVTMTGTLPADFEEYVNIVNARKPMYMYGPAGCGKSYMAKKIAEALGLDYYETSQAMFAHELKGYGDAAGRFVETAFYRAFTNGGVFFLDEVDASAPEALVVLNNAIANGRFDFPVIGNVEAHPDFRVVAAGNTRMTGATLAYVARQMQDTSFKNRFFFELVGYDRSVFYDITGGELLIDGVNIKKLELHAFRKQFGIVLQESLLFSVSIRENIRFSRPTATNEEIEAAAKVAEIHDFIMTLDKGYDTLVGDFGVELSVGQKQRINIARAICANPAILIMDEATSSLDSDSEQAIQKAMDRVLVGRTSFVVAHRLSTIKNSDQIILLDKGVIQEQGTHDQLMAIPNGRYHDLYTKHMGKGVIEE